MLSRHLNNTPLQPGIIGMGTWRTFDVPPDSAEKFGTREEIVSEAISRGVNLFDSSPMYGYAEEILAIALGNRRSDVIVATKVWSPDISIGRQQIERALGFYVNYVDVYQVHNLVCWKQYLPILKDLQKEGRVKTLGVTHYSHSAFAELERIMESEQVQAIQIPYNAADEEAAKRLLPLAEQLNIGVVVMSPFGAGSMVRASPPTQELKRLEEFGVQTWAQTLLKWVVSDPRITVTIPATSQPGRMTEDSKAGDPPFFGPAERERVSWLAQQLAAW
jgi:diketogulonate reductase-like aldo/keto reductase